MNDAPRLFFLAMGVLVAGCRSWSRVALDIVGTCVPESIAADEAFPLEVEYEWCPCGELRAAECTVSVDGSLLRVSAAAQKRDERGSCSPACRNFGGSCQLPALAAGEYELQFASKNGRWSRSLIVDEGEDARACWQQASPSTPDAGCESCPL